MEAAFFTTELHRSGPDSRPRLVRVAARDGRHSSFVTKCSEHGKAAGRQSTRREKRRLTLRFIRPTGAMARRVEKGLTSFSLQLLDDLRILQG